MAEIINLRRARKAKARSERDKQAAHNRLAFGRHKKEKAIARAERKRNEAFLDAHRREPSDE